MFIVVIIFFLLLQYDQSLGRKNDYKLIKHIIVTPLQSANKWASTRAWIVQDVWAKI